MNELLKGLIGAELTLLGVPNQALPKSVASEPDRALPHTASQRETHGEQPVQLAESRTGESSAVQFSESHYRIAAG
jgi:hypothetical protein